MRQPAQSSAWDSLAPSWVPQLPRMQRDCQYPEKRGRGDERGRNASLSRHRLPRAIVARKSRYGKTFYSCSTLPECDVIVNELDQLEEKFHHERTAYKKAEKSWKKGKAGAKEKTAAPKKLQKLKRPLQKQPKINQKKSGGVNLSTFPRTPILFR